MLAGEKIELEIISEGSVRVVKFQMREGIPEGPTC